MAWEPRPGGTYYYRKRRLGGRVVSQYVPGLIALGWDLDRVEQERERAALRAEREAMEAEDRDFAVYFDRVERVARAAIEAAGYHRHARGTWRRRRMAGARVEAAGELTVSSEERYKLLQRAQRGDESSRAGVRAMLQDANAYVVDTLGSPASHLESRLARRLAGGDNLAVLEAVPVKLRRLREELAGPDPSPLERLLAERIALCWCQVHAYEATYEALSKDLTIEQHEFHGRRIDRAHRRYLSAIKTLATVRKLAVPTIQVNVGAQQVNVAGA